MNITVVIDMAKLARKETTFQRRAQLLLKSEVARGCDPYVPFDSGTLAKSVQPSVGTNNPYLVYNTPYARRQYYGFPHKRTQFHTQASMQWFERWKASDKGATIQKIKALASQNFNGG